MTARREARSKPTLVTTTSQDTGIPAALALGRCVAVWAGDEYLSDPPGSVRRLQSARRRFGRARGRWLTAQGVADRDGWQVIGSGAPWEVEAHPELLAGAGVDPVDVPALRRQAEQLTTGRK